MTGRVRTKFLAAISRTEIIKATRYRIVIGGGGGNRTAGSSRDSDDSRTFSRTGIDENTSKEHEQNVLPDILVTMSQMPLPDVMRELAEVRAMFEVLDALRRKRGR